MQKLFDRMGVSFSVICTIHCLFLPVILLAVPTLTTVSIFSDEHLFHLIMILLVIPAAAISFFIGCRQHADRRKFSYVLWLFFTGITILLFVAFTPSIHELFIEKVLTVAGSATIAAGHILNHTLCRKGVCHTEHDV